MNKYFQTALSNFTYAAASGDAIRHLAERGYVPQEIKDMLDFPTPYEKIQETYWEYLIEKRILVEDVSMLAARQEKVSFVTDIDAYGRRSLRRVVEAEGEGKDGGRLDLEAMPLKNYAPAKAGAFCDFLKRTASAGDFVSCDFAALLGKARDGQRPLPEKPGRCQMLLPEKHRLYLEGIPWNGRKPWHRLDGRMMEILPVLYEQASYHGTLLLLERKERLEF